MKYGLIGEKLGHSFSKEIHEKIADYSYELCEVSRDKLDDFMKKKDFLGINVTIPYKTDVIPYLDVIDSTAKKVGAVNTVVNRDGRLYGYNTDFIGMKNLILRSADTLKGKSVLILGSGGTSRTAVAVCRDLGAKTILRVSRGAAKDESNGSEKYSTEPDDTGRIIGYDEATGAYADADVIINTTPSGMYPKVGDCPIDISHFTSLSLVIDVIYNPVRTNLILDAIKRKIPAEGGLYMLVGQAVAAATIFTGRDFPSDVCDKVYRDILSQKENVYLVGMPGCGKSHIGKLLSGALGKVFVDTDARITDKTGRTPAEIITENGEAYFRNIESEIIAEISDRACGAIIATGGGIVLREENLCAMRRSGRIIFIDRPLDFITPTPSRPLSCDRDALEKRYNERYPIYVSCADFTVKSDNCAEHTVDKILNFLLT